MFRLTLPYPPGYEVPGIGYFLLIGGITLCFIGIVIYTVATAQAAEVRRLSSQDPSASDDPEKAGVAEIASAAMKSPYGRGCRRPLGGTKREKRRAIFRLTPGANK
jgi:hypothetical protein